MASISEVLKTFIKTYSEINPNEDKQQLHSLYNDVWELEAENQSLKNKVFQQGKEIERLNEELQHKKRLQLLSEGYFIQCDDGTLKGPICPKCYSESGFVNVLATSDRGAHCSVCKSYYKGVKASVQGYRQKVM